MKTVGKIISGIVFFGLLILWWTWGYNARYEWADIVIKQKEQDGWVVADKGDKLVTLSEPWTIWNRPVSEIAFIKTTLIAKDAPKILGTQVLWMKYNDGYSKAEIEDIAIDCDKKQIAILNNKFTSDIEVSQIKWRESYSEESKVISFVCK